MITLDIFQMNGSSPKIGPDQPFVYTGPLWKWSSMDPKLDLLLVILLVASYYGN